MMMMKLLKPEGFYDRFDPQPRLLPIFLILLFLAGTWGLVIWAFLVMTGDR